MIRFTYTLPGPETPGLLVLAVCQNHSLYQAPELNDLIQRAAAYPEFNGDKEEQLVLYQTENATVRRVLLLGLGPHEKLELHDWRAFAGRAVDFARARKLTALTLAAPSADCLNEAPEDYLTAILEGATLANHAYTRYKAPKEKPLTTVAVWADADLATRFKTLPEQVQTVCAGTLLARDWVNTAPNHKTPDQFADSIGAAAQEAGLKVTIWDEAELVRQKFGALLAVAAGSQNRPRLVILEHTGAAHTQPVVLVGKGVTFDSGGINLKPADGLKNMKMDMAGAAAVAATLISAARLQLKQHLVGVIPIVENMPSGLATRPGDVVTSRNGKTIEINNTDAEGRLILADALNYAVETFKPRTIIDLATLTGACLVALGENIAGLFSPDDSLTQHLMAAGRLTHERCWPMPLPTDYKELLKSEVADISNISESRWGGAITAALFLQEFTAETPWAHLDIAGPAFAGKATPGFPKGGSGFGVRLLLRYLSEQLA